jgi:hypothetical protein
VKLDRDCPCRLNEDGTVLQLCTVHLPDDVKRAFPYRTRCFDDDPRITIYIPGLGFVFQETSGGNVPAVRHVTGEEEEYGGES